MTQTNRIRLYAYVIQVISNNSIIEYIYIIRVSELFFLLLYYFHPETTITQQL